MRRWLLACVGILLVADGYWASQNLVRKSADDGIYWFTPQYGIEISVRNNEGEKFAEPAEMAKFEVSWLDGRWTNNDQQITDIRNFIRYEKNFSCSLTYSVKSDPSVQTVIKSIEAAFASGAGSVIILEPLAEWYGETENSVPLLEKVGQSSKHCPYADDWDRMLDKDESAYGYPPNVKAAKKAN